MVKITKVIFWNCLFIIALAFNSYAQDNSYFKSFGAADGEQGNVVKVLDNGFTLTGMQLAGFGGGAVYPGLLLTDESGNKVFCKKYNYLNFISAVNHVIPNDDGFLLIGTGNGQTWLLQTDEFGEQLWAKTISAANGMHITDVCEFEGSYYMTGRVSFGPGSYPEIVCLLVDSAGEVVWIKQIDTSNYHLNEIKIIRQNDALYLAGTGKVNFFFLNAFMMKLDLEANPIWTKHFSTDYDDEVEEFLVDESGKFYIIGRNATTDMNWNVFLFQTDSDGNLLNSIFFDRNGNDEQARCATFIDSETLAINFDAGGFNSRSPAVMSINLNDFSINWCKQYVYEAQFTNYVLGIDAFDNGGLVMVGDMHVIGKIRDTYLIRTTPEGDAGCGTFDYNIQSFAAPIEQSSAENTSQVIDVELTDVFMNPQDAPEIVEFEVCSDVPPISSFVAIPQEASICEQQCYTFENNSRLNPIQFIWTFENGDPAEYLGENPPEVCWYQDGLYEVRLTVNSNDGSGTSSQWIEIDLACPPSIPNVFSPNNDGLNDFFFIDNLPAQFQLRIFNRWGQLVFESSDPGRLWNGENGVSGNKAVEGVYFYEFMDLDHNKSYSGNIELLR